MATTNCPRCSTCQGFATIGPADFDTTALPKECSHCGAILTAVSATEAKRMLGHTTSGDATSTSTGQDNSSGSPDAFTTY